VRKDESSTKARSVCGWWRHTRNWPKRIVNKSVRRNSRETIKREIEDE
jgi:hypothetical protein